MQKGLTLIEAIVAVFILAVGIFGILQMFPVALQREHLAKKSTVASYLAQETIEEFLSRSYDSVSMEVGTTTTTTTDQYQIEVAINWIDPDNNLQATTTDLGIKKIKVVISWEEGVPPKSLETATLFAER